MCSSSDFPHECAQQPEPQENENYENRKERSLIFHLIYAMESYDYDISLESIVDSFNKGFELDMDPQGEVATAAQAIIDQRSGLDEEIKPLLTNWRFDRIGVCTKLILRMAIWELQNTSIEPKIIINEAIELAKCFAERDAYKFVNGILDQMLKKMGKAESSIENI